MTTSPASASVPTVVGMTHANAAQALLSLGYHVKNVEQASSAVPPGVVTSMSPPPGTRLALGGTVELTVSATIPRNEPVRIVRMSIEPEPRRLADGPLVIVAVLDPGPDQEELQWWMEQLRDRVNVRAWGGSTASGSLMGMTSVQVEATDDQLEAVARRLVAAIEEANAAYPERYEAWRREHDARVAEERRREERRAADRQAILDRVMDEYRSNQ
jgi:PASTA domain